MTTHEGWRYLAVLLDAHARRIVGWALAEHLRAELALGAPAMAPQRRRPGPGLVPHTDRGSQDTAAYQARLTAHGLVCSMSRAGECLDNAVADHFFATLKAEPVDARPWPTRASARLAIFAWIAIRYSRQCRHSALGHEHPTVFEEVVVVSRHAA